MIEEAKKLIRQHEGFSRFPYRCTAGKLTIGYGRNLEDVGISKAEAEILLENDIRECCRKLFTFHWFYGLDQARKIALVDMCYNLGFEGFCKFKRMIDALSVRDYDRAADEMLDSKWAQQVGRRAQELAQIMRTGELCLD